MSEHDAELARLQSRLTQRERELEAVRRITLALQAQTRLDDLLRETLHTAVETVDASAGSILLHDPDHNQLQFRYVVGEKADMLTGWRMPSDEGVAGRVFRTGIAEITPDAPADPQFFRQIDEETRFQTRNMVTVPLKTSAGKPIGVMQVLNKAPDPFTESDRAVLEILSAQAASAMETAGLHEDARLAFVARTIGNISHDMANMLQASVGGAETLEARLQQLFAGLDQLRRGSPRNELWPEIDRVVRDVRGVYPEVCQMIGDATADMQERARQIVEAVRGGIAPPEFRATRIPEVIGRVFRALQLPARRVRASLVLEAPADLPLAEVDGRGLYNAIYNLVSNAVDATASGGTIAVRVTAEAASDQPDGGRLQIEVCDSGSGISPGILACLFTDRVVTTKRDGTGLGTKIVHQVVARHGGTIGVTSKEGEGTTVTIRLPLRQEQGGGP